MKRLLTFLLIISVLYACNSTPDVQPDQDVTSYPNEPSYPNAPSYPNKSGTDNPTPQNYSPQPGDAILTRGDVQLDSAEVLVMESYPVQITLVLNGNLPTPCNQLRVTVEPPDEENRIQVDVYSVSDPGQMCTQVLEPFEVNFNLGSFSSGHYSVWVNEKMVGEFDS